MHVVINSRSILKKTRSGIGRYTFHLLESLAQIDQDNQYSLYCPQKIFDFKRHLTIKPVANFKTKRDYFGFGPKFVCGNYDIYHSPSPDNLDSIKGKIIVTIHDLIYKTYPQSHTPQTIALSDHYIRQAVKRANKVICVSQNTREDLHRFFDLPKEKTCVVYHGVDHKLFYVSKQKVNPWMNEVGIHKPFILFVGTVEPRKNLLGVLKSLVLLKSTKKFDGQLVVAGMKGWLDSEITPSIKEWGLTQDVVFTNFISDEQLRQLYNLTQAFIFPSFYEGFGFPILEAFSCGAPVVTSNTTSCQEIAGNAALLVDPNSPQAIAEALGQILDDHSLKNSLMEKGLQRAKEFSFLKTAQQTLAVYQEVTHEG